MQGGSGILRGVGLPLYLTVVLSFSIWATVHLLLCLKLGRHNPSWGLLGFLLPPLAIYYAQRRAVGVLSSMWVIALSCYVVALTAGLIG